MLYDLVQCPHRVTMDLFEDFAKRDPINPFVQLLWEKGNAFEREVIEGLQVPFVNLRFFSDQEREKHNRQGDEEVACGKDGYVPNIMGNEEKTRYIHTHDKIMLFAPGDVQRH